MRCWHASQARTVPDTLTIRSCVASIFSSTLEICTLAPVSDMSPRITSPPLPMITPTDTCGSTSLSARAPCGFTSTGSSPPPAATVASCWLTSRCAQCTCASVPVIVHTRSRVRGSSSSEFEILITAPDCETIRCTTAPPRPITPPACVSGSASFSTVGVAGNGSAAAAALSASVAAAYSAAACGSAAGGPAATAGGGAIDGSTDAAALPVATIDAAAAAAAARAASIAGSAAAAGAGGASPSSRRGALASPSGPTSKPDLRFSPPSSIFAAIRCRRASRSQARVASSIPRVTA